MKLTAADLERSLERFIIERSMDTNADGLIVGPHPDEEVGWGKLITHLANEFLEPGPPIPPDANRNFVVARWGRR